MLGGWDLLKSDRPLEASHFCAVHDVPEYLFLGHRHIPFAGRFHVPHPTLLLRTLWSGALPLLMTLPFSNLPQGAPMPATSPLSASSPLHSLSRLDGFTAEGAGSHTFIFPLPPSALTSYLSKVLRGFSHYTSLLNYKQKQMRKRSATRHAPLEKFLFGKNNTYFY